MGKQLVLTATQAARILGVGKSTIYRRTATGELASKTVDAKLVIPLSALKKKFKHDPGYYEKIKEYLEAGLDPVTGKPMAKSAAKPAKKIQTFFPVREKPAKKPAAKKGAKK